MCIYYLYICTFLQYVEQKFFIQKIQVTFKVNYSIIYVEVPIQYLLLILYIHILRKFLKIVNVIFFSEKIQTTRQLHRTCLDRYSSIDLSAILIYILSSFEFDVHLKFIFCVIFWGVITAHLPKILHPKKRLKHIVLQLYRYYTYIHLHKAAARICIFHSS